MKFRVSTGVLLGALSLASCGTDAAVFEEPGGAGGRSATGSAGAAGASGGVTAMNAGSSSGGTAAGGGPALTEAGTGAGGSSGAASSGAGGRAGSGFSAPQPIDCKAWPKPGETVELAATLDVSGVLDGGLKRYVGVGALSGDGQAEDMPPIMRLAPGTLLKNVVIGKPASDGIHCDGTCYLQNVWWEDVGEDAATLDGSDTSQTMTVECAGARHATDKIFQHNGPGSYVLINVYAADFNKLYRSCGNCLDQYRRNVSLSGIHAEDGQLLVGINENYGDVAHFSNISVASGITICSLFEANDTGAEPDLIDSGADPVHCRYESSDIQKL